MVVYSTTFINVTDRRVRSKIKTFKNIASCNDSCDMLNKVLNVKVSDTRKDDSSSKIG